jgi:hypothetical protein
VGNSLGGIRVNSPAYGSLCDPHFNIGARHVSVVTHIDSSRLIRVTTPTAKWGRLARVPILDVSPNNDWTEVRVWHIPGGHWGGRIYRADGFIHPFQLHAAMS